MNNNNIVKIGTALKWRGIYDSNKIYYQDNIVFDAGCIFRCRVLQTQNQAPIETSGENGHLTLINENIWDVILDMSSHYNKMADLEDCMNEIMEQSSQFKVEFEEVDQLYRLSNFYATLTIKATLHFRNVTSALSPSDIVWTRYSEFADGTPRVADDNVWNAKHTDTGVQLVLTRADLGVDNGYMPKTIRFTATVTWQDGKRYSIQRQYKE